MSSLSRVRGISVAPNSASQRMRQLFVTPNHYAPSDWELSLLTSSERVTLRSDCPRCVGAKARRCC